MGECNAVYFLTGLMRLVLLQMLVILEFYPPDAGLILSCALGVSVHSHVRSHAHFHTFQSRVHDCRAAPLELFATCSLRFDHINDQRDIAVTENRCG